MANNASSQPARTLAELAVRAKVSAMTVSRALRGHPEVGAKTAKRIQKLAEEMQYRPNISASRLRSKTTGMIGTVLQDEFSKTFLVDGQVVVSDFLIGISKFLAERNYHVMPVFDREIRPNTSSEAPVFFRENCVDGLICMVGGSKQAKESLKDQKIPAIWLDTVERLETNCIWRDEPQAVHLAMEALVAAGHQHIAYIRTEKKRKAKQVHPTIKERLKSYEQQIKQRGLQPCICEPEALVEQIIAKGTSSRGRITAAICYGQLEAFVLSRLCAENGIRIPSNLSVVSIDSTLAASYYWPDLSTVVYERQQAGRDAAEMVLELIGGQSAVASRIIPATCIAGQSILSPDI